MCIKETRLQTVVRCAGLLLLDLLSWELTIRHPAGSKWSDPAYTGQRKDLGVTLGASMYYIFNYFNKLNKAMRYM